MDRDRSPRFAALEKPITLSQLSIIATPIIRWESPRLLPAALALAAVLSAAVIWFYPRQVRQVRWPWRWIIPGLRAGALIALALALARPVAVRREPASDRGEIAVLLDRSASMDIVDNARTPAELVALADALGMLPAGSRDGGASGGAGRAPKAPALADLSDAFGELRSAARQASRAQGDLDYARVSDQAIAAAQTRFNDAAVRLADRARAVAQLAGRTLGTSGAGDLRGKLQALGRLASAEPRGTWLAEVRRSVDQADRALSAFQVASDRKLYDTDPRVRAACAALEKRSRFDMACRALLRPGSGLLARLGDKNPVAAFAFASRLTPLGALRPVAAPAAGEGESSGAPPAPDASAAGADEAALFAETRAVGTTPDGAGTDLADAVSGALSRLGPGNVRAVVVLSDGREVGADDKGPAPAASGVPVYCVAVAPAAPPRDVAFDAVAMPSGAFVGESVLVRASLRAVGLGADPGDIRLRIGDAPGAALRAPDRKERGRGGVEWAVFNVKLDQPGAVPLTFSIPPVPGEATDRNNAIRRWIKVLPDKIRIAAWGGQAGWDFQFLRSALARTRYVRLESGLLEPDRPKLPLTPEQILRQDVLVLDDVPASALSAEQWDAVYNKLVRERGGSVILIAGSGGAIAGYPDNIAAAALLPYDPMRGRPVWKVWPGERPDFRLAPARGVESSDLGQALRLEGADARGRAWQELPALYRIMPVPIAMLRPNARALLVESGSGDAVLSEARPGLGRSLLLGTDETWRWRLGEGERLQERFWVQLVRYAAEEPYADRQGPAALDVDPVSAPVGQAARIRARLYDQSLQAAAAAEPQSMRVSVLDSAGRVVRTVPLAQAPGGGGRWMGQVNDLPVGDYLVRLVPPGLGADAPAAAPGPAAPGDDDAAAAVERPLSVPLHITDEMDAEMRNVAGDPDRLKKLAESTGGEMLTLEQIAALPARLANVGDLHPRELQLPLWDSPYLFAAVVACFAAEWALRKRFGLA